MKNSKSKQDIQEVIELNRHLEAFDKAYKDDGVFKKSAVRKMLQVSGEHISKVERKKAQEEILDKAIKEITEYNMPPGYGSASGGVMQSMVIQYLTNLKVEVQE